MKSLAAILTAGIAVAALTATLALAAIGDGVVIGHQGRIKVEDKVVAQGYEPAVSPDGSRLAFVGKGELYVARIDGRGKTRLTRTAGQEGSPAWSPDGRTLAFTHVAGGLFTVDLATKKVTRILGGGKSIYTPSYSPDGKRIAYGRASDEFNSDIWVANADGSKPRRLTHTVGTHDRFGEESAPDWSPDGKTIVFASNRSGNGELYLMTQAGKNVRRITSTPKIDEARPRYSRDGIRLLYLEIHPRKIQVAVSSAHGGRPRILELGDSADWR